MTALAAAAASLALLLAGCSSTPANTPAADGTADTISGDVAVSAAASLKGAFDTAIDEFTAAHPDVKITANYDGSSTLATQINGGAKVDVFASADEANMAKVTDPGLASDPVIFARNTLVVVVPKGNPGGVTTLQDLANKDLSVVLCAPEVPCGAASQTLLKNEGVTVTPASQEQNVTAVLTKVSNDEADAGMVYKTDAATTDQVDSFVPDGADQVVNSYPIVVLKDAPNKAAAQAFVDFITGADGQKILDSFGFDQP
ncbi:molybdate ABC transporter substrate-binding protein [Microbacterium protaetiae]